MSLRPWLAAAWLTLAACGDRGTAVPETRATVACGTCIFKLPNGRGCYWAIDLDGRQVPVTGPAVPLDHESHAPDGMCNVARHAVVEGTLYADRFDATRFELEPAAEIPATPRFTPADVH